MRILTVLSYYRPYTSGLTIYAERLARALAARGHAVQILTTQHDPALPTVETLQGVAVHRLPVRLKLGKGLVAPGIILQALASLLRGRCDILQIHLPQPEAAPLVLAARLLGKPAVITYHCDLQLPPGGLNRLLNSVSDLSNHAACRLAPAVVTNTRDYAEHSPFLRHYLSKLKPIYPPVELQPAAETDRQSLRRLVNWQPGQKVIGIVARLAAEKGVEHLAQALPLILAAQPQARILFVGPYQNVPGEAEYGQRVQELVAPLGERWQFLGALRPAELTAFYELCDLTVLPSTNSTESFGMVQIEAMSCGTPVVASDLPGVRQPVALTGLGRVAPSGDPTALAAAICEQLAEAPERHPDPRRDIAERFGPQATASAYEQLFQSLLDRKVP